MCYNKMKKNHIFLKAPNKTKSIIFMKNPEWEVVVGEVQGWRKHMEDAHVAMLETPLDPSTSFFGVFDGHGGRQVSTYTARNLHKFILNNEYFHMDITKAIKKAYLNIDEQMLNNNIGYDEGSTAITILIKNKQVYCANVGDSRAIAVINGQVKALSTDQKPDSLGEQQRIVEAGIEIKNNRVLGSLAMARALGDFRFKSFSNLTSLQQPVIALPEITVSELTPKWEFIVIGCDGIWDVMTNLKVACFVKEHLKNGLSLNAVCATLLEQCLANDTSMPYKGCDNMTAIILLLSETLAKQTNIDCSEITEEQSFNNQ